MTRYARDAGMIHVPRPMPEPTLHLDEARIATLLDAVDTAAEAAEHAAHVEVAKRDAARGARAMLASTIREAAAAVWGSVTLFTEVVGAEKALNPRSVWNALYSTFSADYLARCLEVLADARLAPHGGDGMPAAGQSRRAA